MFVEAKRVVVPIPSNEDLKELTASERVTVRKICLIYEGDIGENITDVQDCLEVLWYIITTKGYTPTVDTAWGKKFSKEYIQPLPHPTIGRDRQAIAIGYLVSALVTHELIDLVNCGKQLQMLRDYLVDDDFKI